MSLTVPVTQRVAEKISRRAVTIARANAPKRTGKGAKLLSPMRRVGEVGIRVPSEVSYMVIQERGMKPRIMWELEGRVIPLRTPGGTVIFRTATNVGRRQITTRDEKGRIVSTKIRWRHPGLAPKNFMANAIAQATNEWLRSAPRHDVMETLVHNQKFSDWLNRMQRGR